MKKLSKKSALLFVGAMAACAFAMPSMSSAATWSTVGTEHTLHSPDIGFSSTVVPGIGTLLSQCSESTLTIDVRNANVLTVTSARFGGTCTITGPAIGTCTLTTTATNNPNWTVTAPTTSNIQIHPLVVDLTFEQHPGGGCINVVGARTTITGTLTGGQWNGNGAGQHGVVFANDSGLFTHNFAGSGPVTIQGTFRETGGTLNLA
jgi:hypothetical protein